MSFLLDAFGPWVAGVLLDAFRTPADWRHTMRDHLRYPSIPRGQDTFTCGEGSDYGRLILLFVDDAPRFKPDWDTAIGWDDRHVLHWDTAEFAVLLDELDAMGATIPADFEQQAENRAWWPGRPVSEVLEIASETFRGDTARSMRKGLIPC